MTPISDSSPAIAPSVIAGLLLAARDHQQSLGLPSSGAEQIVEKSGASRSSAYEAKSRLLSSLSSLVRPVGRPAAPAAVPTPLPVLDALCHQTLRFVMDHPGSVYGGPERRKYSDAFRLFVLDRHHEHPGVGVEALAKAIEVPLDTLRDWLRLPVPPTPAPAETDPTAWGTSNLHIQALLSAWETWEGAFAPFCDHVREHLLLPYRRTIIANILEAYGVRLRKGREGRSPDEKGLRKTFETFFPGAQWVADGSPVLVVNLLGKTFGFNVELVVDAHTGAFTGVSLRDQEDAAALVEAVADGKATTGAAPLAVLVDNRPSNLTPEVGQALAADGALLIPATPARPQNKAHVEGGFGLFRQMVPPLILTAATDQELAREVLRLVVLTWGRTLNHRPRADRGNRSRIDLYGDNPTPEQVAQARAALEERLRRQQDARRTLQARQDPQVRVILAAAFESFGIADPGGQQLDAIARYPLWSVVDGIAVFAGKRAAGTLPHKLEHPGRYLAAIVRNHAQRREADRICEEMIKARLETRDALLAPLVRDRDALVLQHAESSPRRLACFVDNALETDRLLDRLFWLSAAGEVICGALQADRAALYLLGARRIHAHARVSHSDRLRASTFLAGEAVPLE